MLTLITGSNGFLGKHFREIMENSNEVFFLTRDRMKSPAHPNLIEGDLSNNQTIKELKKYGFDRLIHFAWEGLPAKDQEKNRLNYVMTKTLIDSLLDSNPLCELNLMGSCLEINMDVKTTKAHHLNDNDLNFAKIKRELLDYVDLNSTNYRWFRIFYVFGVGQHENSLINVIYRDLKNGKIPILKNINSSHDYIFAEDAVNLIYKFITLSDCKKVIDIGTGLATGNFEILSTIATHFGIEMAAPAVSVSDTMCADLKLIKKYFPDYNFHSIDSSIDKILTEMQL